MKKPRRIRATDSSRQGAILVFAMIALLVASMIGASLLRTALMSMHQIRREQQHVQAHWLLDAGCQRALLRSRTEADYTGEDWNIAADQLTSQLSGVVRITIKPMPDSDTRRTILVVVEYPLNSPTKIQISKQLIAEFPKPEPQ